MTKEEEQVIYDQFHGKLVRHKFTNYVRKIYVLQDNLTPSGEAILGKYNSLYDILYDTYIVNIQFYDLLN